MRGRKSFRFDKRWISKLEFKEIIREGWLNGNNDSQQNPSLGKRIQFCRSSISRWRKQDKTSSEEKIESFKWKLERAVTSESSSTKEVKQIRTELQRGMWDEEIFWRQKSRRLWLKEGDKNTHFFQASTKQRRAQNQITGINNRGGGWTEREEDIHTIAVEYFRNAYQASESENVESALTNLDRKVSPKMNSSLTRTGSPAEIKAALFAINPEKAPGPDGMNFLFFQKYWDIIRPSYGWISIQSVRDLALKAVRRTIGLGAHTSVWNDAWLPRVPARPPNPRGMPDEPMLRVTYLINADTKTWNIRLLNDVIERPDIPKILSLYIGRQDHMDGYCWNLTKNGRYTVKSGYQLACEEMDDDSQFQMQLPSLNLLKKKVWNLKCPQKICHFFWQMLAGALPVGEKITQRKMSSDPTCARCGGAAEYVNHTIFQCPPAIQAWALAPIPTPPSSFPLESLYQNVHYILNAIEEADIWGDKIRCVPWVAWYIWKGRNESNYSGKELQPPTIVDTAIRECEAWEEANRGERTNQEEFSVQLDNSMITTATFVCRIDGSWKESDSLGGVGWVLHLQDGTPDILGMKAIRRGISPLHMELHSLLWAMESITSQGRFCDLYVTDYQDLVDIYNNPHEWPTFSAELKSIADIVNRSNHKALQFQPRENNEKTDFIAKSARRRGTLFTYINTAPPTLIREEDTPFVVG